MDEKRLGLNPNPPGRLSPEIYDEIARRLTDLGETGEVETLRRMLDRALPAGIPAREARGQLDNLTYERAAALTGHAGRQRPAR